ncbi:hypothetical protein A0257_06675 [Hymenobacter psoromatis]|nr:hypothetical protein A0257_06675 [Hymenobacter psoromatis]
MRQLKLSRRPANPTWEADRAQFLPLLQSLAAGEPLGLLAEDEEKLLQFIASVAWQYQWHGVAWETLLRAGYKAAVEHVAHCAGRKEEVGRFLAWAVRQGILRIPPNDRGNYYKEIVK